MNFTEQALLFKSSPKPAILIPSCGEPDYISWNKLKEDVLAVSVNNDIRIYDIRVRQSMPCLVLFSFA